MSVSLSAAESQRQRPGGGRVGHPDYPLLLTVIAFLAFGLVMVYSATTSPGRPSTPWWGWC